MADDEKLRQMLEKLQAQVDEICLRNPSLAESLQGTLAETKAALTGQSAKAQSQSSLIQRLRDSVIEYEASHPALSQTLGRIIDALAEIGI